MAEEVVLERIDGEGPPMEFGIKKENKVLFAVAILIGFILFLLTLLLFLSNTKIEPKNVIIPTAIQAETAAKTSENARVESGKIDSMVHKANALYLRGETEQALHIYEQIALYSESLSNYNLGVAQMSQNNYSQALDAFKQAILSNENQTVAAINAAVCALYLNDNTQFDYYINLAQSYVGNEGKSELFNYYLALIYYYKGFYPEALQMLQKIDNEIYEDNAKYLSAKILAKLGRNEESLKMLYSQGAFETSISTGLLYARMGEYDRAIKDLERAMKIDSSKDASIAALNLIDLKLGKYSEMIKRVRSYFGGEEAKTLDLHRIKVSLKPDIFDPQLVQSAFKKDFMTDKKSQADLIFYFAPYQVFDTKQASGYINKANVDNFLQRQQNNIALLNASSTLSSVNVKLAKIIHLALNHQLHRANDEFKALLNAYSEHSILHFNLALSYAQLQRYDLAHKHFTSSYHLDPKNYAAGAYAVICSSLLGVDDTKFIAEIKETIAADTNFKGEIYQALMSFASDDYIAMMPYFDSENADKTAFGVMTRLLIAKLNNLPKQADALTAQLYGLLKSDLMANILYFNARNSNLNIKEYAQNAQIYFRDLNIDYNTLARGANVLRDNYILLMRVAGIINQERDKIKSRLARTSADEVGLSEILAYMDIYAGQFQEAYGLYDTLINDYKVQDSRTYFLAAVAAVGSQNVNAALALLELARLADPLNQEVLLALGLLYHEVRNYEPALFQYSRVKENFLSEFFDFAVVDN